MALAVAAARFFFNKGVRLGFDRDQHAVLVAVPVYRGSAPFAVMNLGMGVCCGIVVGVVGRIKSKGGQNVELESSVEICWLRHVRKDIFVSTKLNSS